MSNFSIASRTNSRFSTASSSRQAKRAFTLVELLVVVAIISLLISMLLPALAGARGNARRTLCLSNLRAIALANNIYAHENDDKLPLCLRIGDANTWNGQLTWWWTTLQNNGQLAGGSNASRYAGPLLCPDGIDQEASQNGTIWGTAWAEGFNPTSQVDPAGRGYIRDYTNSNANDRLRCNYAVNSINLGMMGWGIGMGSTDIRNCYPMGVAKETPSSAFNSFPTPVMTKVSQMKSPGTLLLAYDGLGYFLWASNANISRRHGAPANSGPSGINVTFVDGHGETLEYGKYPVPGGVQVDSTKALRGTWNYPFTVAAHDSMN